MATKNRTCLIISWTGIGIKSSEERWNYEFRNTPTVKFRVVMLADNDPSQRVLAKLPLTVQGWIPRPCIVITPVPPCM
jgi:CRISPR/Cas system-associated endonuclease Cas3-HD